MLAPIRCEACSKAFRARKAGDRSAWRQRSALRPDGDPITVYLCDRCAAGFSSEEAMIDYLDGSTAMKRSAAPARPLRIALFAYPGVQALDLSGPLEMFARATRLLRDEGRAHPGYSLAVRGRSIARPRLVCYADLSSGRKRRVGRTPLICPSPFASGDDGAHAAAVGRCRSDQPGRRRPRLASLLPNAEMRVLASGTHHLGNTLSRIVAPLIDQHLARAP
jgi:hypothetical protein